MTDRCTHVMGNDFVCGAPEVEQSELCAYHLIQTLKSQLASALARAEAAEMENEAWSGLASYGGVKAGLRLVSSGDGSVYSVQLVHNLPAGKGATPAAAAIDLATKLGLLKPVEPLDKAGG